MKKILLIASIITFNTIANGQSRWSIGVMLGGGGNISKYSGGTENADALFSHVPHGTGQIGVYARYKINDRLSFQGGYDFSEIGFTYLFARDYSLNKEHGHYERMKTGTCISRMPALIIYNSKLNCRNLRFITGAGLALEVIDKNWKSEKPYELWFGTELEESLKTYVPKTYEAHSTAAGNGSFAWLIGIEKVFRRGNMLSFTLQGNCGFTPIAKSTVQYYADGTSYSHTFTNYGSYCAFGISYYFLPVGSRKLNRISQD